MSEQSRSMPELFGELKELVVAYARQETVEPIKGLGRYLAFGVAGSILVGTGLALGILALLRALQTETGTRFDENLSWAPYGIVALTCVVMIAIAIALANRGGRS